jgi:hypothetical protein
LERHRASVAERFLEQTFRSAFIFPDFKPGQPLGFLSYYTQRKALMGKTARIVVPFADKHQSKFPLPTIQH